MVPVWPRVIVNEKMPSWMMFPEESSRSTTRKKGYDSPAVMLGGISPLLVMLAAVGGSVVITTLETPEPKSVTSTDPLWDPVGKPTVKVGFWEVTT